MRKFILFCSFLFFASGCATYVPYLTPVAKQNQGTLYRPSGMPVAVQHNDKAEVMVSLSFPEGYASYLWLEAEIKNLSQETLQVHSSDLLLLDSRGIMQNPADLRTAVYELKGVKPQEQKNMGDRTMESFMGFFSLGLFNVLNGGMEDEARKDAALITQNEFRDFTIPPGTTARGARVYNIIPLTYPLTVVLTMQGDRFEFQFDKVKR